MLNFGKELFFSPRKFPTAQYNILLPYQSSWPVCHCTSSWQAQRASCEAEKCGQLLDSCHTPPPDDRPSVSPYQGHLGHLKRRIMDKVLWERESGEEGGRRREGEEEREREERERKRKREREREREWEGERKRERDVVGGGKDSGHLLWSSWRWLLQLLCLPVSCTSYQTAANIKTTHIYYNDAIFTYIVYCACNVCTCR